MTKAIPETHPNATELLDDAQRKRRLEHAYLKAFVAARIDAELEADPQRDDVEVLRADKARLEAESTAIRLEQLGDDLPLHTYRTLVRDLCAAVAAARPPRDANGAADVSREPLESSESPDLTARQAASLLQLTRPDGTPRDSFYRLIEDLGGYRAAGRWRFPRSSVDAFRASGRG